MCSGYACRSCPSIPQTLDDLRVCQHTNEERHHGIENFTLEPPTVGRVKTKEIAKGTRIEIDFASADIAATAVFFDELANAIRRRGRIVLVVE